MYQGAPLQHSSLCDAVKVLRPKKEKSKLVSLVIGAWKTRGKLEGLAALRSLQSEPEERTERIRSSLAARQDTEQDAAAFDFVNFSTALLFQHCEQIKLALVLPIFVCLFERSYRRYPYAFFNETNAQ